MTTELATLDATAKGDSMTETKYGAVRHVPGKWPEWVAGCSYPKHVAEASAERLNHHQINATILAWPPGTRFFAVKGGTTATVYMQLERIVNRNRAAL